MPLLTYKSILVKFHVFRLCLFKDKKIVTRWMDLNTLHVSFSSSNSFAILALSSSSTVGLPSLAKISGLIYQQDAL